MRCSRARDDRPDPPSVTHARDKLRIERIGAGHCTGQFAFAEMIRLFGDRFDPAGVGSVIPLPV